MSVISDSTLFSVTGAPVVVPLASVSGLNPFPVSGVNPFFCDVCRFNSTSQPQFDIHLAGKGHHFKLEKLKNLGPKASIEAPVVRKENYNIYRTPSGQYYCAVCNLCVDSDTQFGQHLDSKKHKQKHAASKPQRKYC